MAQPPNCGIVKLWKVLPWIGWLCLVSTKRQGVVLTNPSGTGTGFTICIPVPLLGAYMLSPEYIATTLSVPTTKVDVMQFATCETRTTPAHPAIGMPLDVKSIV